MKFVCPGCKKFVDFNDAICHQDRNGYGNTIDWKFLHPECYERNKEKLEE